MQKDMTGEQTLMDVARNLVARNPHLSLLQAVLYADRIDFALCTENHLAASDAYDDAMNYRPIGDMPCS